MPGVYDSEGDKPNLFLFTYDSLGTPLNQLGAQLEKQVKMLTRKGGGAKQSPPRELYCSAPQPTPPDLGPNVSLDRARLLVEIHYRIKATHDRRSLVYPFYLIPEE